MPKTENPEEEFDLRISGGGINVERKIDSKVLAAVMAAVMGAQGASDYANPELNNTDVKPQQPNIRMSLREYLDDVQATRKPDQIVAIGHFISHYEERPNFSRDEIRARFSTAKEPMPANFSRDFGLAVKAGMLAEVHLKQGQFYVTKTGIRAVERCFAKAK
ncbi:MAG: hypothetical protein ISR48_09560 [Alphaproteobacteria bacterium]|nr:hypothetical protein [Alphaproteobacteria bacterium]